MYLPLMITVKQLKDLLSTFQNQPENFPSVLDSKTLKAMRDESAYAFSFFAQFAQGDEDDPLSSEILNQIRGYFKVRWEFLKKKNLAYTRYPFLPVNQLCLKVAEGIADPEEAVCRILMPS